MWDWIKNLMPKIPPCKVCGNYHGDGVILESEYAPRDTLYPGHEYVIYTQDGGARPEVWRLGLLRVEEDDRDGATLIFTAAREHQDDETFTIQVLARDIYSAREVTVDKMARHGGRNAIREVE